MKADDTLDCIGLYCPMPIANTAKKLRELEVGQVLEVLADDPAAEADIRSLAKRLEQEIVDVS